MRVCIDRVSMQYENKVRALDAVSLDVGEGIFGLLGKNGAGKSTLMRILSTLQTPTEGRVFLDGKPLLPNKKCQEKIGYMPQELGFHPELSVQETLEYFATLYMMDRKKRKTRIIQLLEEVNLQEHAAKKVRQLSGGMKRRLGLAQALINDPSLLIVDEPTAGLDPEERIRIRVLLTKVSIGKAVFFSTHVVEDIASTCAQLAILEEGKLVFQGDVVSLIAEAKGHVYIENVHNEADILRIQKMATVTETVYDAGHISLRVVNDSLINENKAIQPRLEDAFVYVCRNRRAERELMV